MAAQIQTRGREVGVTLLLLAVGLSVLVWLITQRLDPGTSFCTVPITQQRAVSLVLWPSGPGQRPAGLYPNMYHRDPLSGMTALHLSFWVHDLRTHTNRQLLTLTLPTWPMLLIATGLAAAAGWAWQRKG